MRVISIDPGYDRIGLAVIEKKEGEKETLLFSECFQTDKSLSHANRLALVGKEISSLIDIWKPEVAAIENLFFGANTKTALKVSEVRGVILFLAAQKELMIYEYTPIEIKIAVTGYGRSDKKGVIAMVQNLISIKKEVLYDDEYDAIAVGLTHFATTRYEK